MLLTLLLLFNTPFYDIWNIHDSKTISLKTLKGLWLIEYIHFESEKCIYKILMAHDLSVYSFLEDTTTQRALPELV